MDRIQRAGHLENIQSCSVPPRIYLRRKNIDVVQLNIWKEAHQGLSNIIEVLIESPDRAFHRDYRTEIVKVNEHLNETKTWNLEDKIQLLKKKQSLQKYV